MNGRAEPGVPGPARPPSPRLGRAAVLLVAIALAAAVTGLVPRMRHRAALAAETHEMVLPTVEVVRPEPAPAAPAIPLPAEIKPWIDSPIYARASGYLGRWFADLGARVEAGDVLAELETPELDQQLEQARHDLSQAEAALHLARVTAERYARLMSAATVSQQDNDEKQAELALKKAAADSARAEVRRLEQLKSFARIVAPFRGVITVRGVDVGELVTAGGDKEVFRLAQTERLRVFVRVPQALAISVAPGQKAELLLAERPGRAFAARVARASGAISAESRTLLVELEVDNTGGEILAGSYGEVRLIEAAPAERLLLPGNALLFRAEGPQVGVVGAGERVALRSVKLGRDFGAAVEIIDGVGKDDRVILNPPDSIADGSLVRVAGDEGQKGESR